MSEKKLGYFTEEKSIEAVIERISSDCDLRLKEVMSVIIKKLHEAVKEIEPTQDEWMKAIMFLTETGHKTDDWRQEYILLSDILGVSMLVDAINSRRPNGASENTVLGPFHIEGVPETKMGTNISLDGKVNLCTFMVISLILMVIQYQALRLIFGKRTKTAFMMFNKKEFSPTLI